MFNLAAVTYKRNAIRNRATELNLGFKLSIWDP